jgi:hypothetical protein
VRGESCRGLEIARGDVVVRHVDDVYHAHLEAMEAEMDVAGRLEAWDFVRTRLPSVRAWRTDPLVPDSLRDAYEDLDRRTLRALSEDAHA